MLAHGFFHDGAGYEVSFRRMDGQWFAAVSRQGGSSLRALPAFADNAVRPYSDEAIRAGYIGLAEWLVRSGDWLDANPGDLLDSPVKAPVNREKTAPCIDRGSQEQIGRELQAMYSDVLDEPVPDKLLSLLQPDALPAADEEPRRAAA